MEAQSDIKAVTPLKERLTPSVFHKFQAGLEKPPVLSKQKQLSKCHSHTRERSEHNLINVQEHKSTALGFIITFLCLPCLGSVSWGVRPASFMSPFIKKGQTP